MEINFDGLLWFLGVLAAAVVFGAVVGWFVAPWWLAALLSVPAGLVLTLLFAWLASVVSDR